MILRAPYRKKISDKELDVVFLFADFPHRVNDFIIKYLLQLHATNSAIHCYDLVHLFPTDTSVTIYVINVERPVKLLIERTAKTERKSGHELTEV